MPLFNNFFSKISKIVSDENFKDVVAQLIFPLEYALNIKQITPNELIWISKNRNFLYYRNRRFCFIKLISINVKVNLN